MCAGVIVAGVCPSWCGPILSVTIDAVIFKINLENGRIIAISQTGMIWEPFSTNRSKQNDSPSSRESDYHGLIEARVLAFL